MHRYELNTMRHLLGDEEPENYKHLREMLLILNSLAHPIVIWQTARQRGKKAL